jgi:hypothetical protein
MSVVPRCPGDAERIREEDLSADERERLRAEGSIQGVDGPQPSLGALHNVVASIAATLALQIATDHDVALSTFVFDPWGRYLQPIEVAIDPECLCRYWRERGDATALPTLRWGGRAAAIGSSPAAPPRSLW